MQQREDTRQTSASEIGETGKDRGLELIEQKLPQ